MAKLYAGQSYLRIQFSTGQDLTGCTVACKYRKPDGTEGTFGAMTISGLATAGVVYYDIAAGDIPAADYGEWLFWASITFADGRIAPTEEVRKYFFDEPFTTPTWAFCSVSEIKDYLGLTGTTYDTVLTRLLTAASGFIETETKRRLMAQDWDATDSNHIPECWYDGDGSQTLITRQWPINSISLLTINGETVTAATATDYYGSTGYVIRKYRRMIYYASGFSDGIQNVRLSYNAGYVAGSREWEELKLLTIILVGVIFNARKHLGFKSETMMNYRYTRQDLKDTRYGDPLAESILNKYKRRVVA